MVGNVLKLIWTFLVPGGLVLSTAVGFLRPHGLPLWLQPPVAAIPYVVFAFGLLFGWYLSSTRMLLSLLVVTLVDRALTLFPLDGQEPASVSHTIFAVTAFLLPLNLLAFSILKEEAISTIHGAIRVILVLAQPFFVLWLCYPEQQEVAISFQRTYLEWLPTAWTPIPQPALCTFVIAGVLHLTRFVIHRDPLEAGSAWALAGTFLAYHGGQFGWQPTPFFAAAGLILLLSLIQSTHQRTYRDELTGIAGRLAYEEAVGRLGREFSLAVLAVDQLKSYGNMHGKSVGEQILKLIAPRVQAACLGGRVYRISGEELTLLFSHRSAVETLATLETVRKTVETISLVLRGRDRVREDIRGRRRAGSNERDLPVTVSIGVAEKATEGTTVSLVIKAAYRALYEAKSGGGNVVKRGVVTLDPPRRSYGNTGRIMAGEEY